MNLILRSCQSRTSNSKSQARSSNYQLGTRFVEHTCPHWDTSWKTITWTVCLCKRTCRLTLYAASVCVYVCTCLFCLPTTLFPPLLWTPVVEYVYVHFWNFVRKLVMLISHCVLQLHQGDSLKKVFLCKCKENESEWGCNKGNTRHGCAGTCWMFESLGWVTFLHVHAWYHGC